MPAGASALAAAAAAPLTTGGLTVHCHPAFARLPLPLQTGWVAHAVLHIALRHPQRFLGMSGKRRRLRWLVGLLSLLAVGLPLDCHVFNLQPTLARLPLIGALCAGTLPYLLANEAWTRDPTAPPAAYLVSRWIFKRTGLPAVAAVANALAFAGFIGLAFLLVA